MAQLSEALSKALEKLDSGEVTLSKAAELGDL